MTKSQPTVDMMYVQCAYCREWIDVKPGKVGSVSHTVCPKCLKKIKRGQKHPAASSLGTPRG